MVRSYGQQNNKILSLYVLDAVGVTMVSPSEQKQCCFFKSFLFYSGLAFKFYMWYFLAVIY